MTGPSDATTAANAAPAEFGRSVIVAGGRTAPSAWATAPRVVIDEDSLTGSGSASDSVDLLHKAWSRRSPIVIDLHIDPVRFRTPTKHLEALWQLGAGFRPDHDWLHFLVWNNAYDARSGSLVWWWARKAGRLGATEHVVDGAADVTLPDGRLAWIDGGPRAPRTLAGAATVSWESVEGGRLVAQPAPVSPTAELAADQLAAVAHESGPARIIAPAGSGKTRVLTERYRHLLSDRRYEREGILALAYNKKAQLEMAARLAGLGARVQTINAWGYEILGRATGRRPSLLDEREIRTIVQKLVPPKQRRVNTDRYEPYIEGLSLIRLGLLDPAEVESALDDVDGLAAAYEPYRAELAKRGAIDFDEQVFGAVEALLRDGELRRSVQAEHRHLLVDEFQDLTPAHVLLVRLAAGPPGDVFGVGDDDQTIYGHAGADPRFLVDYDQYFPGAGHHALEVNYRCPAAATKAASQLLGYNRIRVDKTITAGPAVSTDAAAVRTRMHDPSDGAAELVEVVQSWLREGIDTKDVAVLTRVNSLLLAPHVALAEAGVPIDSVLTEAVLDRLGVRSALAYLRIACTPASFASADLVEVYRRPSRGLPPSITKWLERCRSATDIRKAAARIEDSKVGAKLDALATDVQLLGDLAGKGATTRQLLMAVRDQIGLGSAMTLLDSTGAAGDSHLDDIEGLMQVADLHADPNGFGEWLEKTFRRERVDGGVTLSTIHRVKGMEWNNVVVFGASDGLMPHRLSTNVEEERRVLHVAITRCKDRVVVLGDASRRSPFLAELDGTAPKPDARPQRQRSLLTPTAASRRLAGLDATPRPATSTARARRPRPSTAAVPAGASAAAVEGMRVRLNGGFEGSIESIEDDGARVKVGPQASMVVRFGERVQFEGRMVTLTKPAAVAGSGGAGEKALREWRTRRAKADGVAAYMVLSDAHLIGIAVRNPTNLAQLRACAGVGPTKLESYGEEILDVLANASG